MAKALAPKRLTDHDPRQPRTGGKSSVAPAHGSRAGETKVRSQRTESGEPARSFATLMADIRTLDKHETRGPGSDVTFAWYTRPTPLQEKASGLLGVSYRM